jgi:hypothetical protein
MTQVIQNQLIRRLPAAFLTQFSQKAEIAYTLIPLIPNIDEPVKTEVRVAFAESLRVAFLVLLGVCFCGFFASLIMQQLPLHTSVNRDWILSEKEDVHGNRERSDSRSQGT